MNADGKLAKTMNADGKLKVPIFTNLQTIVVQLLKNYHEQFHSVQITWVLKIN